MLLPKRLAKGDTIGVIAPAGPPKKENLMKGIEFLESLGLHVTFGKHIDEVYGYLAGTDTHRLSDFHEMVANPHIRGIILARGGYGTARLAAQIDYELIRKHPKIIWGYSDMTYLHTAIRQATGLITFHGPMVSTDMADDKFDEKTKQMFDQLFEPTELQYTEDYSPLSIINQGKASGRLVGGNLALMTRTLGTPFEIDLKDKLLLIEDIGEVPYRVDGMLNQLMLAGKLADVSGIVIGDFAKAEPKNEPSLTLEEVFEHYFADLHCPVMSGFKIGHCLPHFALPLGTRATLDTEKKQLTIAPGVKL